MDGTVCRFTYCIYRNKLYTNIPVLKLYMKPISPSFWFRETLWNENFASSLFHEESEKIVVSRKFFFQKKRTSKP